MPSNIDNIVWTPYLLPGQGTQVVLDMDFAKRCFEKKIGTELQKRMVDNAWNTYKLSSRFQQDDLYRFYDDSLLLSCIYKPTSNGVWLNVGKQNFHPHPSEEHLVYYGHNDESSGDQYWLLLAFQWWHRQAETLLGME